MRYRTRMQTGTQLMEECGKPMATQYVSIQNPVTAVEKMNNTLSSPWYIHVLITLIACVASSCDTPETTPDLSKPLWEVYVSESDGEALVAAGLSIGLAGWKIVYTDGTNYNFAPQRFEVTPAYYLLDFSSPNLMYSTSRALLSNYYASWGYEIGGFNQLTYTHIFGVPIPAGAPLNTLGVTTQIHNYGQTRFPAASYVFVSTIVGLYAGDAATGRVVVDHAILHELGHARGLSAICDGETEYIDHTYHIGTNPQNCVMNDLRSITQAGVLKLCDYHKTILSGITTVQSNYSPESPPCPPSP